MSAVLVALVFGLLISAACTNVSHRSRILVARSDAVDDTGPTFDFVGPDVPVFDVHPGDVPIDVIVDVGPDRTQPDIEQRDLAGDLVDFELPPIDADVSDLRDALPGDAIADDLVPIDVVDADQLDVKDVADIGPISCTSNVQCSQLTGPCTVGVCVNGGCVEQQSGNGIPCNDGSFCTIGKRCQAGACVGSQRPCPNPPGDPCRRGQCSESEKKCVIAARPDGAPCIGDTFSCTNQVCANGSCVLDSINGCLIQGACYPPGANASSNQCLGCNPQTSQFNFSALPNGTSCVTPDGRTGACQNGACSQWSRITFQPGDFYAIDHRGPSKGVFIVGQAGDTGLIWRLNGDQLEIVHKTPNVRFRSISFDIAVGERIGDEPSVLIFSGSTWSPAPAGLGDALKFDWRSVLGGDNGNVRNFLLTGAHNKVVYCFCLLNFGCLDYSCSDKDVLIAPNSFAVDFTGRFLHATLGDGTSDQIYLFAIGSDVDQGNTFQDVAWFSTPDDAFLLSGKSFAFTGILSGELLTAFGDRSSNLWVAGTNALLLSRLGSGSDAQWKTYGADEIGLSTNANLTTGYADAQGVSIFGDRPTPGGGRELFFLRGQRGADGTFKWIAPLVFAQTPPGLPPERTRQLKARDIDYIEGTGFVVVGSEPSPNSDLPTGVIWIFAN
ncbi:MAG: hypothetical protein KC609_11105 [Myxococcales bacterium]|nr:hypothetical protein [Myxococcales bacterium]